MVKTLPLHERRNTEEQLQIRRPCGCVKRALSLTAGHKTFRLQRKSQSLKLHDRTQAGPPKELRCAHARENVQTINASAKGQESTAQPSVTQQQLDLARINLEGIVAYTFSCSCIGRCKCCHARLSHFTVLKKFMLKEQK